MAVPLHQQYIDEIKFYILGGSGEGVGLGDRSRVDQALGLTDDADEGVPNSYTRAKVYEAVDRVDTAYREIQNTIQGTDVVASETYVGDLNRTVQRADNSNMTIKKLWETYHEELRNLARILWVPEFMSGDRQYRHQYVRGAEGYVQE